MTLKQIDITRLRNVLEEQARLKTAEIEEKVASVTRVGQLEQGGTDHGEEANHDLDLSIAMTVASRETEERDQIYRALQKINHNEYGLCEECGVEIGKDRLLANPVANRCLSCQTDSEKDFSEADATPSL